MGAKPLWCQIRWLKRTHKQSFGMTQACVEALLQTISWHATTTSATQPQTAAHAVEIRCATADHSNPAAALDRHDSS